TPPCSHSPSGSAPRGWPSTFRVREVVPRVRLQPAARGPAWLAGALVYRGRVVPVVYLRRLLGAGATSWLRQSDGAVGGLARVIYDGRRFEALPVLADLLEEADCSDPHLPGHLRGPGPHVRGCFAVDALLGRG